MKWLLLSTLIVSYSSISLAQSSSQKIDGLVNFDKDSTYWVAVVIKKGLVSTVLKMVFDSIPNQALPPNGNYQIVYRPNLVQFVAVKGLRSYAFRTGSVAVPKRNGLQQWQVKRLSKINPTNYPWVELK